MTTNDGSMNFTITPQTGQGDKLLQELKNDYPRCYSYFDGLFIYLKANVDCSKGFFKKLKTKANIKSIAQS